MTRCSCKEDGSDKLVHEPSGKEPPTRTPESRYQPTKVFGVFFIIMSTSWCSRNFGNTGGFLRRTNFVLDWHGAFLFDISEWDNFSKLALSHAFSIRFGDPFTKSFFVGAKSV